MCLCLQFVYVSFQKNLVESVYQSVHKWQGFRILLYKTLHCLWNKCFMLSWKLDVYIEECSNSQQNKLTSVSLMLLDWLFVYYSAVTAHNAFVIISLQSIFFYEFTSNASWFW